MCYGYHVLNAVRNAEISKKSNLLSPVKSATGSFAVNAVRNADMSKKSRLPSALKSAGHCVH